MTATVETLCDRESLSRLLARHGFHFSKSMGQNFLIDPSVPRAIAAASGAGADTGVLEIGPGVGALTLALAERAAKVVSIELDRDLLPLLEETLSERKNAFLVPGDALQLDLNALIAEEFPTLHPILCANLPYNITTPLLQKFVETPALERLTVLVQREVADRLGAPVGDRDGGAFAVYLHYHMEVERLFDVPSDRFLPRPKVDSAVLRCTRRAAPAVAVADEARFFRLVKAAFFLRRKTLLNSLSAAIPGLKKDDVRAALASLGLPETIRGEKLTLGNFAGLAAALDTYL